MIFRISKDFFFGISKDFFSRISEDFFLSKYPLNLFVPIVDVLMGGLNQVIRHIRYQP